jgi:hypothetical protein
VKRVGATEVPAGTAQLRRLTLIAATLRRTAARGRVRQGCEYRNKDENQSSRRITNARSPFEPGPLPHPLCSHHRKHIGFPAKGPASLASLRCAKRSKADTTVAMAKSATSALSTSRREYAAYGG